MIEDIADRAAAYGMPGVIVDGMDVLAVKAAGQEGRRAGPQREPDDADRVQDLPLVRPLPQRPASLPDQARKKPPGKSATRSPCCGASCSEGWHLHRSGDGPDQGRKPAQTIETATKFAMDSPYPEPAELDQRCLRAGRLSGPAASRAKGRGRRVCRRSRRHSRMIVRKLLASGRRPRKRRAEQAKAQIRSASTACDVLNLRPGGRRRPARRDAARSECLRLRRGRRPLRRRLRGHQGPCWRIRPEARDRHGDLRGGHRRSGGRGGDARHAAGRGDHVRRLRDHRLGPARPRSSAYNRYMFGGKTKVPMVAAHRGRRGPEHRRAPLGEPGSVVHAHAGLYVVMPSTPYDAKGLLKAAIRRRQPGDLHRAQGASTAA